VRDLMGKTAFVTGGASGIGLALGRAFAQAGMNVVLADIEVAALEEAVDELRSLAPAALGVVCDVADPDSVERAAQTAIQAFGKVHVLCNNAGVAGGGGIDDISLSTWKWVLDINVMGVLHGVAAFLPHMRAHGEGGHIVNTASMAGFQSRLGFSPYATSKYAVVAISEGLAQDLQPHGIGVTVLCPSFVRTRISESSRNRPARYGPAEAPDPQSAMGALTTQIAELVGSGMDPSEVAARTVSAIRRGELYVFTHPEARGEIDDRFAAVTAALDAAGSGGLG
jgi:NAD(P)-dependent dehydrogenase (short-subunit alcohol dehydrogenase family)